MTGADTHNTTRIFTSEPILLFKQLLCLTGRTASRYVWPALTLFVPSVYFFKTNPCFPKNIQNFLKLKSLYNVLMYTYLQYVWMYDILIYNVRMDCKTQVPTLLIDYDEDDIWFVTVWSIIWSVKYRQRLSGPFILYLLSCTNNNAVSRNWSQRR